VKREAHSATTTEISNKASRNHRPLSGVWNTIESQETIESAGLAQANWITAHATKGTSSRNALRKT
jgi:hypothetical protein